MEVLVTTYAFDVLVIAAIFGLVALYNSMRGTGVSLIIAVAIPIASFLYFIFPYYTNVESVIVNITPLYGAIIAKSLVFTGLLAISLSLPRTIVRSGFSRRSMWRVLAVSAITTVFMLILIFKTLDLSEFGLFSEQITAVLANDTYSFWIIILSLVALFII